MDVAGMVVEAQERMRHGQFSEALMIWRDVCAWGEPNADAHVAMAICLVEVGAQSDAAFELGTAVALDSSVRDVIDDDVRLTQAWACR